MTLPKYIADGYMQDVNKLLSEFVERNSMKFSVFAEIWRKQSFSLIYMGRENVKELGEFTQEIFCLSTKFLLSESLPYKVGAVFLLYALYHNQIINPPFRIRIVLPQYQSMMSLLAKAVDEKLHSLHYVLENLFEHCITLVAFPVLKGPNGRKKGLVSNRDDDSLNSYLKSNLIELKDSQLLKSLEETFARYARLRSVEQWGDSSNRCTELVASFDRIVASADENRKSSSAARSVAAKNRPKRTYLEALQKSQTLSRKQAAKQANGKNSKDKPNKIKRFQISYEDSDDCTPKLLKPKSDDSVKIRTKTRTVRSYFKKCQPVVALQDVTTSSSSDEELLSSCLATTSLNCVTVDQPTSEASVLNQE